MSKRVHFAAVMGSGYMPQPGTALMVRSVDESGVIQFEPVNATDLAVASEDLELSMRANSIAEGRIAELLDLLRDTRAFLLIDELQDVREASRLVGCINNELGKQ